MTKLEAVQKQKQELLNGRRFVDLQGDERKQYHDLCRQERELFIRQMQRKIA